MLKANVEVLMVLPYNPLKLNAGLEQATMLAASEVVRCGTKVRVFTIGESGIVDGVAIQGYRTFSHLFFAVLVSKASIVHFMEIWPSGGLSLLQLVLMTSLRGRGTRSITTIATYGNLTTRLKGKFRRYFFQKLNALVIGLNKSQMTEALEIGIPEKKFRLCPRGVPPKFLQAFDERKYDCVQNYSVTLFLGRFVSRKRPVELAENWMANALSTQHLQFVGTGEGNDDSEELQLRKLVSNCQTNISIHPWVQDPLSTLLNCDIFVLPSTREGQPNAVLQAMATGMPVVVTKAPGLSEIVTDGVNGRVATDVDSAVSLALELVSNVSERRRLGSSAHRHVARYHNLDTVRDFHLSVYTEVGH